MDANERELERNTARKQGIIANCNVTQNGRTESWTKSWTKS